MTRDPLLQATHCIGAGKDNVMPPRMSPLGWKGAVCALAFTASGGVVAAQTAAAPPAVSVTPVASRQITETGDYIGRVTAIDKVDVVARVPGFIEERDFTEGQQVKKGDMLFRIEQATYKAADGLKEGELVIVGGIQKVRPGQVVTANVVSGT